MDLWAEPGLISLTGRMSWGVFTPGAVLSGTLEAESRGRYLSFIPTNLDVSVIGTLSSLLKSLDDAINPILDMERIRAQTNLAGHIRQVHVDSDWISLSF